MTSFGRLLFLRFRVQLDYFSSYLESLLPLRLQSEPSLLPGPLWDSGIGLQDALLFAVPKKRTSHSKKRTRHAHKYLKNITHIEKCKCGRAMPKLTHVLCPVCLKEVMKETAALRRDRTGLLVNE